MQFERNKINWPQIFTEVIKKDKGALKWGLPEPWVHAELYCAIFKEEISWTPFPDELPYVTYYPVKLPKITNRDWEKIGAVKYVDMCLENTDKNEFLWFEFKVRNTSYHHNGLQANREARDAFKKDVVALIGFSPELTYKAWSKPDVYTKSYRYDTLLKDSTEYIASAKHRFVSFYLHLEKPILDEVWERTVLVKEIKDWLDYREKYSSTKIELPEISIEYHKNLANSNHTLITCAW
jgi:hypothetical protein